MWPFRVEAPKGHILFTVFYDTKVPVWGGVADQNPPPAWLQYAGYWPPFPSLHSVSVRRVLASFNRPPSIWFQYAEYWPLSTALPPSGFSTQGTGLFHPTLPSRFQYAVYWPPDMIGFSTHSTGLP